MTDVPQESELIPPGCALFFSWLVTSIFGTLIGWALGWRLSFIPAGGFSTVILGAVAGGILGGMQWLVLRGHLRGASLWVAATALGWAIGFPLGVIGAQYLGLVEAWFGLAVGLVLGTLSGLTQWLVLRRQVTRAAWWVPASVFAWASALVFYRPGVSGFGAFYGTLAGIVTGVAILWLLYRPAPDQAREE